MQRRGEKGSGKVGHLFKVSYVSRSRERGVVEGARNGPFPRESGDCATALMTFPFLNCLFSLKEEHEKSF